MERVFSAVAKVTQLLGVVTILVGPLLTADSVYPVLPTDLATLLAGGAAILAGSNYFRVEALKARMDRNSQTSRDR
ncbi:hypothetical protein NGM10_09385 [Halorussus salilacus]|uniref:hypothetical protein n=1 Tax=Halorussus salilacus TaxID=2953750 RepID=UPI0020A059C0|nr:hypothetical protein [Halorussus salilacus]USZ66944.1 hypothetical protein NGM10_09385 [Halorussus salilacus]